ncbi:hypothetical protein MAA8898_04384 [Maliponia aquimaris]|uniref:Uncharacterized protein n=2 Tax=Maliponia aquimaris TaxID=1673631 RepID=A0A238L3X0_9RHOB|nr:hypothetical protein MAA8898_04384 [Maliponia aquimaris]
MVWHAIVDPMQKFFLLEMPARLFIRNTLLVSLVGLFAVLVPYVFLIPGFGAVLAEGGPAFSRFLRQILTNGLPVVFAVNYVGFFLIALGNTRTKANKVPILALMLDIPARVAVFVVLHVIVYVMSADWFDSFGGSRATALRVVAPTLARSAFFENLSGVYLYASLMCTFPMHVDLLARADWMRRIGRRLPRFAMPVFVALLWFALAVVTLTLLADQITRWQQP